MRRVRVKQTNSERQKSGEEIEPTILRRLLVLKHSEGWGALPFLVRCFVHL
jgi:hypothetical protein